MDKKTKGSWLIHHTNKLQTVTNQQGYDNTFLAGKAGILLSAISANNQITISKNRLQILAQAANINLTFELPKLIQVLSSKELIDTTDKEISVLGVTTTSALQHTTDIFDSLSPSPKENAAIDLAEKASIKPINEKEACEEIGDQFHLPSGDVDSIIFDAEQIGFVDVEKIDKTQKLFFNGNLFRREETKKIRAVLDSLSGIEQRALIEVNELLKQKACISIDKAKSILGENLFSKVSSLGYWPLRYKCCFKFIRRCRIFNFTICIFKIQQLYGR